MAKNQALQQDDTFEVVYALYQEAKAFSPDAEPHAQTAIIAPTAPIIQSRKPRNKSAQPSLFTRISDLNDEAVATKLLAQTAETPSSDEDTALEDEFAIPDSFAPDSVTPNSGTPDNVTSKNLAPDEALDNEALSLLTNADDEALEAMSDDVRISDEIEPSVSLDDVLDGLSAPEAPPSEAPPSGEALSEEAKALATLDATRPAADDALINQLADVKSAVEQAQERVSHNAADEGTGQADNKTEAEDWQDISPNPALATFIAETVRDVLNEELPHRVRGLVDEALGERQGRYGRSETPHIGLRTKPSRH